MPDNKPNKEKPPISTVAKIIGKALIPGAGPLYAARDIISRISLNRMAENLDPYSYSAGGKTAVQRYYDAVIENKREADRAETEQYIEKGYGKKPFTAFKERVDLLQMLSGKPQKYKTIQESKYRPDPRYGPFEKTEEKTKFYSSKGLEEEIIKDLGLEDKDIRSAKDILDIIVPRASIDPDTGKPMVRPAGVVTTVPGLGQATYSAKRDPKGRIYLTYGDIWDLNPTQGVSAEPKVAATGTIDALKKMGESAAKNIFTDIVTSTATPPNVYGRIYFDPKTGKPIRQK